MSSGVRRIEEVIACVTALSLGLAAPALAAKAKKPPSHAATKPAPPAPEDDGLGPHDVYLEADQLIDDQNTHVVTAIGNAEARYQGRIVRAQKIVYDADSGASHASGDVIIINPDKTLEFAQEMDLDDEMNTGVAIAFSARLESNITMTAGVAVRRNENVMELNHGSYTPCQTCLANGAYTSPTFSISATRILQDHARQVVYYRNAIIKVKGIPVFYAPIFWHPDPTAVRRSGLLTPRIDVNNKRGLSVEQPYLWVINPSTDLTVSPQINTTVNPLLNVRFRERFYSGELDIRAGYTFDRYFDSQIKFGRETSHSYILGTGEFDLNKDWSWGFGAERVSDPAMFARYNSKQIYADRGPFGADTARLISQLFVNREDDHSYVSLAAMSFQSLRPVGNTPVVVGGKTYYETQYENGDIFPTVGPLFEARLNKWFLGGKLDVTASAVDLTRGTPVVAVNDPNGVQPSGAMAVGTPLIAIAPLSGISYSDSRRASLNLDWRRSFIMPVGLRIDPFLQGRADLYSITDARNVSVTPAGVVTYLGSAKAETERSFGTVGADISYPMIRPIGNAGSIVLEPLTQIAISPKAKVNPGIPNEDSTAFEFDDTNLFSIDRSPGYDRYDGGSRVNVGGRATVSLGPSQSASLLVGRSFRDGADNSLSPLSGLRDSSSDWVTYASLQPNAYLSLFNRMRLDRDQYTIQHQETGLNLNYQRFFGSVRYDYNASGLTYTATGSGQNLAYSSTVGKTEDFQVSSTLFFTKTWGVSVNASRDLRTHIFPQAQASLIYQDDCLRLDVIYTHNDYFEGFGAKPAASDSIGIRLTLAVMGDASQIGGRRNDSR